MSGEAVEEEIGRGIEGRKEREGGKIGEGSGGFYFC